MTSFQSRRKRRKLPISLSFLSLLFTYHNACVQATLATYERPIIIPFVRGQITIECLLHRPKYFGLVWYVRTKYLQFILSQQTPCNVRLNNSSLTYFHFRKDHKLWLRRIITIVAGTCPPWNNFERVYEGVRECSKVTGTCTGSREEGGGETFRIISFSPTCMIRYLSTYRIVQRNYLHDWLPR